MSKKRSWFVACHKAATVLEALKEEKSIDPIAAEKGVHPNKIDHGWDFAITTRHNGSDRCRSSP